MVKTLGFVHKTLGFVSKPRVLLAKPRVLWQNPGFCNWKPRVLFGKPWVLWIIGQNNFHKLYYHQHGFEWIEVIRLTHVWQKKNAFIPVHYSDFNTWPPIKCNKQFIMSSFIWQAILKRAFNSRLLFTNSKGLHVLAKHPKRGCPLHVLLWDFFLFPSVH